MVVKSHGSANAKGICSAIKVAASIALSDFADEIRINMQQLTTVLEKATPTPTSEAESR